MVYYMLISDELEQNAKIHRLDFPYYQLFDTTSMQWGHHQHLTMQTCLFLIFGIVTNFIIVPYHLQYINFNYIFRWYIRCTFKLFLRQDNIDKDHVYTDAVKTLSDTIFQFPVHQT